MYTITRGCLYVQRLQFEPCRANVTVVHQLAKELDFNLHRTARHVCRAFLRQQVDYKKVRLRSIEHWRTIVRLCDKVQL